MLRSLCPLVRWFLGSCSRYVGECHSGDEGRGPMGRRGDSKVGDGARGRCVGIVWGVGVMGGGWGGQACSTIPLVARGKAALAPSLPPHCFPLPQPPAPPCPPPTPSTLSARAFSAFVEAVQVLLSLTSFFFLSIFDFTQYILNVLIFRIYFFP